MSTLRNRRHVLIGVLTLVLVATTLPAGARHGTSRGLFEHVGTFDVRENGNLVSEIVDVTKDGKKLVYTDALTNSVGVVDIRRPSEPQPLGSIPVSGQPTSVAIKGNQHALVAVSTGTNDAPDGELVVIDLKTKEVVKVLALGGQPDSIALSPDQRYAAIAIENERIEDGFIPDDPAGFLVVVEMKNNPSKWTTRNVDLTGLADFAPADPEPEYVDINSRNQAVVTLQENNHIVIVDLTKRNNPIIGDFPAGTVDLVNVDNNENGLIELTDSIADRRREPDAVTWINKDVFATANEGDYVDESDVEGGSRGFTLFNKNGNVAFESGVTFEHESVRVGHYNESRSENKGGEPEAVESAVFKGRNLLFVGAERANVIGVYDVTRGDPKFIQALPSGVGPEGLKAIPSRGLLVSASETFFPEDAATPEEIVIPSMITIYQHGKNGAYPIVSEDLGALPIPWVALSGMVGDPSDRHTLYAVSDSFLDRGFIYEIDVSSKPAVIVQRIEVSGVPFDLDLEGIAVRPEGGFWLASEGLADGSLPNAIIEVDGSGAYIAHQSLPGATGLVPTSSGFEGLAVTDDGAGNTEHVYAVIQREWPDGPGGDAPNFVKIARWDGAEWSFVAYEKAQPELPNLAGWVGLSEITLLPDGTFAVIERDNQLGNLARVKKVYGVDLASAEFKAWDVDLDVVAKTLLRDVLEDLEENSVWTPDKFEGLAVAADRDVYIVTDNDGVDEAVGQTVFLDLGRIDRAFD